MIDLEEKHLKIVKEILSKHVPNCEVRVFGSRINGTARRYSDLDLAIVCDNKLDLELKMLIDEDFEDSDLPFRVDVLDWCRIAESFRKVIDKDFMILSLK